MSGPLIWWANRKSQMGLKPSAKKPPHESGKEWFTTPPIACPQPEHIEYVAQMMRDAMTWKHNKSRDDLMRYLNAWMRAARRFLHEEQQAPHRADLQTTDGLIVAASSALQKLRSHVYKLDGTVDDAEVIETMHAVLGRADKIRRERALSQHNARTPVDNTLRRKSGSKLCQCSQHGDWCAVHPTCRCGCERNAHDSDGACIAGRVTCSGCVKYQPCALSSNANL